MTPKIDTSKFLKRFPNEEKCESYIESKRWPRGVECPLCGKGSKIYRLENQKRYKCGLCRKQFSIRTNSILAESKISLQKWTMAVWILTSRKESISSLQLARSLEVTQKTARFLARRISEAIAEKHNIFGSPQQTQKN